MARFMQPFVVTMPWSRSQRQYHQQPTLEQEFADILSDLVTAKRSTPVTQSVHCCPQGQCTRRDSSVYQPFWFDFVGASSKRPWVQVLNFAGFQAGDIDVKVEGENMIIQAKREENDGGNSDMIERRREVKLPPNIDAGRIACFLAEDGRFIIKAPYISKKQEVVKQSCDETESKSAAPKESTEVPICREDEADSSKPEEASGTGNAEEKQNRRLATTSLADFIVSALTGDYVTGDSPRNGSPVTGEDYVMLNGGDGEKSELTPLTDTTDVIEEDGKKYYCVKVKLPSYPQEGIRVRCHGRNMFIDAKRVVEEPGIYHCHEFHRRYTLPENVAEQGARALMDDSGTMTVKVPLAETPENNDIPIEHSEQRSNEQKESLMENNAGENKELCKDEIMTDKSEGQ